MSFPRNLILSVAAATLSTLSFAQSSPDTAPTDVGVSPRTAEEAMQQAVPRSDTATVTSTGESPPVSQEAENAQDAAGNVGERAESAVERAGDATGAAVDRATEGAGTATTTTTEVEVEQEMRVPRADRN